MVDRIAKKIDIAAEFKIPLRTLSTWLAQWPAIASYDGLHAKKCMNKVGKKRKTMLMMNNSKLDMDGHSIICYFYIISPQLHYYWLS